MNENEIRADLEEIGLTDNQIAEVLPIFKGFLETGTIAPTGDGASSIRLELANATDWRTKASLAAQLISMEISTGNH